MSAVTCMPSSLFGVRGVEFEWSVTSDSFFQEF